MKNLITWIVVIGIGYFVYQEWAGGEATEAPVAEPTTEGPAGAVALTVFGTKMKSAMFMARGGVECGYSDVGYAHYTPDEAAQRLVDQQNTASVPDPAYGDVPGSEIQWVVDGPPASWTVVVRVDDAAKRLVLEGYGQDLARPLETLAIACSD